MVVFPGIRSTHVAGVSPPSPDDARFDRASWIVLGLAVLFSILGLFQMVYVLALPSDGWSMAVQLKNGGAALSFQQNFVGAPSAIRSGDVLIAIDDQSVDQIVGDWISLRPRVPSGWTVGQTATYVVVRDGHQLRLDVPLVRRPLSVALRQVRNAPWEVALLIIFAGISLFVFVRAPRHPAARAMLILGADEVVGLGVYPNVVGYPTPSEMFDGTAGLLRLGLLMVFFAVYVAVWVNLFVVFPTIKGPMGRSPVVATAAIYGGPVVIELVALGVALGRPDGFYNDLVVAVVFNVVVTFLVVVISVIYSLRTLRDAMARAQLRWMVFAIILSDVVPNLLGLFNVAVLQTNPVVAAIQTWLSVSFPIAMAVAILRYRLFAIDVIVNRTLVYGPVTVGLGGVYFGSVLILQQVFRSETEETSGLAIVLSTLAIAALFFPVRDRVQRFVDRRFYRKKYDVAQAVAAFGGSIRDLVDVGNLAQHLVGVIDDTMQPVRTSLWLRDSRLATGVSPDLLATFELSRDDALVDRLVSAPEATRVRSLNLNSRALRELKAANVELVVPLVDRDDLLGLLNLGPRLGGQDYLRDDRRLLNALASQAVASVRIAKLVQEQRLEAVRQERVEQEFRIAAEIQQALLPRQAPRLEGWDSAMYYQPARVVGGDFFDFLTLPSGKIAIIVGDVTGNGLPAALLMASILSVLRTVGQRSTSPSAVLREANDRLCLDRTRAMYATCLYAILDPATGVLQYASAGHTVPYCRTPTGITKLMTGDLPLGSWPGIDYQDNEIIINPGDILIFYTDGIVDAVNAHREVFGFPRMERLVSDNSTVQGLVDTVVKAVMDFRDPDPELADDLTMAVLQRRVVGVAAEPVAATPRVGAQNGSIADVDYAV